LPPGGGAAASVNRQARRIPVSQLMSAWGSRPGWTVTSTGGQPPGPERSYHEPVAARRSLDPKGCVRRRFPGGSHGSVAAQEAGNDDFIWPHFDGLTWPEPSPSVIGSAERLCAVSRARRSPFPSIGTPRVCS
jgi:hypothetical protein